MKAVNNSEKPISEPGSAQVVREQVACQFSRAAGQYRQHDVLQRLTAFRLLGNMPSGQILLDIGAGPGTDFSHHIEMSGQVWALDIARGMLAELKRVFPGQFAICGDAQQLPLTANQVDRVYSNLALQWCPRLELALDEVFRVLKPGGSCHLALVVEGSLPELSQLGLHRNAYPNVEAVTGMLKRHPWKQLSINSESLTVHFDTLRSLLQSVKGIGASARFSNEAELIEINKEKSHSVANISQAAATERKGLNGKGFFRALESRAESLRTPAGLPLSYQVLFIHACK